MSFETRIALGAGTLGFRATLDHLPLKRQPLQGLYL